MTSPEPNPILEQAIALELAIGKYQIESRSKNSAVLVDTRKHNRWCLIFFPPLYVFTRLRGTRRLVIVVDKRKRVRSWRR